MAAFEFDPQVSADASQHQTAPVPHVPTEGLPSEPNLTTAVLHERAELAIQQWQLLAVDTSPTHLLQHLDALDLRLRAILQLCRTRVHGTELTPQLELLESTRMLQDACTAARAAIPQLASLPRIQTVNTEPQPRILYLADDYLAAASGIWSTTSLTTYLQHVQTRFPLQLAEILQLPQALNLAQLEFLLHRAEQSLSASTLPPIEQSPFSAPLHSLRRLNQQTWRTVLEPLVPFDAILRQDPTNVYSSMDDETRDNYRLRVAELARHADFDEIQTAQAALDLARTAARLTNPDPRHAHRISHIGCYLFAEGLPSLTHRIGYHAPPIERVRTFIRQWNEEFYILGIFSLTLLLIVAIIAPLVPHHAFWPLIGALLLALVPTTQGALDLINGSVAVLFKAVPLPKLDFSKAIPASATTLVVVPTLLLNEKQVDELFDELESRYLANQDPNLHFGLLTDLPDSIVQPVNEDRHPLVQRAIQRTEQLNTRYAGHGAGAFLLLHRHRIFNARQGVWMGWERKRGKLLDLNKFLLDGFDSFPIKSGPTQILQRVRYIITLDSDTQLPRGTAARMIGTIAHPLNQAIIHPQRRVVTAGYGILQPRVGVSIASASRSRLSALYSGETGFDIYTRAVSDVYQDLFGEGIFTGKGIYEVSVLHSVLDRRFPRNALLSHDLIEGSYARAGLVSDIEVIDDYPSHHSAHTRRKHRWMRGDWQIVQWLFARVPDESGRKVPNPISTISRWKIFDNLRRSLAEPLTFLLLLLGWFVLPGGALYWTAATILLLLLPVLIQFGFNLTRALVTASVTAARESLTKFATSLGFTLLNIVFLPLHAVLSLDAILRSLIRSLVSGKHLLEWETAAQAETGGARSAFDSYLRLSPAITIVIAVLLAFTHPHALLAASPVLLLWAVAPLVVDWLNASPIRQEGTLPPADCDFLLRQALLIWRFFLHFGGEHNHWLIPDNVEEQNTFQVRTLSPTNLGMLFNARQAAVEFGFLTLPDFAHATLSTLSTYASLERYRGHIYNWYNIETLQPIPPFTLSAVDSGNLAAGLYTLHSGALDLLLRPILSAHTFTQLERLLPPNPTPPAPAATRGAPLLAAIDTALACALQPPPANPTESDWTTHEAHRCLLNLAAFVEHYTPWLLPRFEPLFALPELQSIAHLPVPSVTDAPTFASHLAAALINLPTSATSELSDELRHLLAAAQLRLTQLRTDLSNIASESEQLANAMDFSFMLVESRQLLSIGFDGKSRELHSACYDLLASEARTATFLAIAKGDIPQQAWFNLGRAHVFVQGRAALISWTGTMFEYMMPTLWMRSYPNTLLSRSLDSVVHIQQQHLKLIPWGISESGHALTDIHGRYAYHAWGIPSLALKYGADDGPVISPYSTFLALPLLQQPALANLRRMASLGWTGAYGFYEAADYTAATDQPRLVRSWMAHHQGMSLLAITNLLHNNIVQRWFHANPRVRAAELLLHEKPLSSETLRTLEKEARTQSSLAPNPETDPGPNNPSLPSPAAPLDQH